MPVFLSAGGEFLAVKKLIVLVLLLFILISMTVVSVALFPGFMGDAFSPRGSTAAEPRDQEFSGWNILRNLSTRGDGSFILSRKKSAVPELALTITEGIDNDYDKMVAIYDWVTANIAYDLDKAENIAAYGYGAEYLLETGSGICHDYAELTRALLKAVDIEATYEKGEVIPAAGETELHAWNRALVDGTWYALDTTWGSGFFLEDRSGFVQKPSRIYLTSPEELVLLHHDPEYKMKREKEYLREISIDKPVVNLPGVENDLFYYSNEYRDRENLPLLSGENRLTGLARSHSTNMLEAMSAGNDFSLQGLSDELTRQAAGLGIKSASMNAYSNWLYYPDIPPEFLEKIIVEHAASITERQWDALAIGASQKGEFLAVIFIFVAYN